MKAVVLNKPFDTEEEYFAFEEKSELKHEYINSTLFEMSGASKYHNLLLINLVILLKPLLKNIGKELYVDNYKVRTPDGNYFYPDLIISEPNTAKYYTDSPAVIVEVLSDSTRAFDFTDKFIQYRKFTTLQYYLCIEPEVINVIFYYKSDNGEWQAEIFTKPDDVINLPKLGFSISLKDIYQADASYLYIGRYQPFTVHC
jgi:Uma2 family endonuclease